MKKYYLMAIILFWFNSTEIFSQLLNPGFESETGSTINDWTNNGTGIASVGTLNARTGNNALSYTTSSYSKQDMSSSSTITIPNNYYAHIIGWVKGDNVSAAWASLGIVIGASESTTANDAPGTTFKRYYMSRQNTQGSTQNVVVKLNNASGSGTSTLYWDDIHVYVTSYSSTADIWDPNFTSTVTAVSNADGNSITLNWTQGTDAQSGIRGAIVLRADGLSQTPPELNDQGRYSTSGGSNGPNTIGAWTVVATLSEGIQTFTDNAVTHNSEYTYAVYMRDDAYNYSGARTSSITALPVELSSFSAYSWDNAVNLQWQTATEVNNYGFEVERASSLTTPSQEWERIGFIEGHGNSNSPKDYSFIDKNVSSGKSTYRLKQIDTDGKFEYSKEVEVTINNIPTKFELKQNYPNPFNPNTKISWQSPIGGWQTVKVYDVLGNEVATLVNEYREAGSYEVEFDAANLSSGIYYYKLQAGIFAQINKMMLLK